MIFFDDGENKEEDKGPGTPASFDFLTALLLSLLIFSTSQFFFQLSLFFFCISLAVVAYIALRADRGNGAVGGFCPGDVGGLKSYCLALSLYSYE